ncbi:MAG: TetR/AcrR family transcriptional regulator C-terminal domain-containing protein [Kutzneria sp.]|nr:TetR/AcrR family transcriptional regulator C-terminal domain-containing protein [Kutzneria sp.]MBV9847916.1 TetR/AcrR family transcriptional regulator C-terminal domain-containing protein [Kutzneria sp.]
MDSIRPQKRRRGRPPAGESVVSREAVLAAGLRVLERNGLDALTMRNVAEELGVRAASMYWHVRDKDELLDLLSDELLADVDTRSPLDSVDWRVGLATFLREMRCYLLARRDSARLLAGRFSTGSNRLRCMEAILGALRSTGLDGHDTAYACYFLIVTVLGFVANEQAPLSVQVKNGMPPREFLDGIRDHLAELPVAEYPNTLALATEITGPDLARRFDFAVERMLDGIDALRRKREPSVPVDRPSGHEV